MFPVRSILRVSFSQCNLIKFQYFSLFFNSSSHYSNQDLDRHKRHTSTQGRKESSNLGKKFSATIGANQGEVLKSLNVGQILPAPVGGDLGLADDDEQKENDDPSMECESFFNDNAKTQSQNHLIQRKFHTSTNVKLGHNEEKRLPILAKF